MKLTRPLLQLVDKLQQASKIDKLQQVCGIFGCVLQFRIFFHAVIMNITLNHRSPGMMYLIILKLFFPQKWIIILQFEYSQHNKQKMNTEGTFTTATCL